MCELESLGFRSHLSFIVIRLPYKLLFWPVLDGSCKNHGDVKCFLLHYTNAKYIEYLKAYLCCFQFGLINISLSSRISENCHFKSVLRFGNR